MKKQAGVARSKIAASFTKTQITKNKNFNHKKI